MIITGMFFLDLFCLKVEVVNLIVSSFTRLPSRRKRSFESFLSDVEEVAIFTHIHTEVLGVLFNLLLGWLIVRV